MPNEHAAGEYRIGRLTGKYVVTWWVDGKRRRYRLNAQSRKEAEAEAVDVIRRETVKPASTTVADLWEGYRKEKAGRRVVDAMKYDWVALGPHFGHLTKGQVTVDVCRAYIASRKATMIRRGGKDVPIHDGTIWTELGHLRTVLRWAYGEAAPRIERPAKPAPKDRWLTRAEAEKLVDAATAPHIKLAIMLMLGTAGRVGAILELTWERVDFDAGTINLRTTDTGPRKGRAVVPMNAGLRAALSAAERAATTDNVIEWAGSPVKRIRTGFRRAVKDAGLKDVSEHVLRHTAAVHMAAAGRPMARISQYLGHSSVSITEKVYARFAPDHLREEADVLDFTRPLKIVS
jgi:site-specific recombinase XerD